MNILTEIEYEQRSFKNLTLDGEEIRGKVFEECHFKDCSFHETGFIACTFTDCTFTHCDMNLMQVKSSRFRNVDFTHCQLSGVNWSAAAPAMISNQAALKFTSCGLNYSTFIVTKYRGMVIRDCAARDVDFSDADLQKAIFCGTDLTSSRFVNTDLTGADFRGAHNYIIPPEFNKIKGAYFSLPDAIGLLYGLDIHLDEDE
jgi:fluoroquinolone resistance protein